jgi:hypothetical protein
MDARRLPRAGAASVLFLSLGCTDRGLETSPSCEAATSRESLVHGTVDASFLALAPEQRGALGRILSDDGQPICSLTLVGHEQVVTAGHCLTGETATIELGAERSLARVVMHDDRSDIALLGLEHAVEAVPIPILGRPLDESWLGEPVLIGGMGLTEDGTLAEEPQFLVEAVAGIEPGSAVVDGRGLSGACLGDSGGPLLIRNEQGFLRLAGILVRGSASCLGRDEYASTAPLSEWLAPRDSPSGAACDGLEEAGFCRHGRAMFCAEGVVHADECGPEQTCGWSREASGFRCVDAATDPCLGLGDLGACIGNLSAICREGVVAANDCGPCGTCIASPQSGSPACSAD